MKIATSILLWLTIFLVACLFGTIGYDVYSEKRHNKLVLLICAIAILVSIATLVVGTLSTITPKEALLFSY